MDVRASIKVWVEFYLNWQLILSNLDANNLMFYFLFFIYLSLIGIAHFYAMDMKSVHSKYY